MSENKWTRVSMYDRRAYRCGIGHFVIATKDFLKAQSLSGDDMSTIPCPTCAEIKAAGDKRGEEVLEMACEDVCVGCANGAGVDTNEGEYIHVEQREGDDIDTFPCDANEIRQTYREQFGS